MNGQFVITPVAGRGVPAEAWAAYRHGVRDGQALTLDLMNAPGIVLDGLDAAVVADALEVAAEYRRYRASLTCPDCAVDLCEHHAADLDRADAYDQITAKIGDML